VYSSLKQRLKRSNSDSVVMSADISPLSDEGFTKFNYHLFDDE